MKSEGARLCLYLAIKKLNENDLSMAKHRAEEAVKLIDELQNENKTRRWANND